MYKSSLQIYRDLVRLVNHIGARTPKGELLLNTIRSEFRANKHVTDKDKINELQEDARRALSNYLVSDSLTKMRKRKDVEGDVMDGSQPEYEQVKFDVGHLDSVVQAAFEKGDQKATTESKKGGQGGGGTDVLEWATEGEPEMKFFEDEEDEARPRPAVDPEQLADAVSKFGTEYTPRNPNDGVLTAFFQAPEEQVAEEVDSNDDRAGETKSST